MDQLERCEQCLTCFRIQNLTGKLDSDASGRIDLQEFTDYFFGTYTVQTYVQGAERRAHGLGVQQQLIFPPHALPRLTLCLREDPALSRR